MSTSEEDEAYEEAPSNPDSPKCLRGVWLIQNAPSRRLLFGVG